VVPLTQILSPNRLAESLGWEQAGYWEAMWRISAAYLMLFTNTFAVYYLPKLSELKSASEIRAEIL
jgi:PST family polysaccharide transporter